MLHNKYNFSGIEEFTKQVIYDLQLAVASCNKLNPYLTKSQKYILNTERKFDYICNERREGTTLAGLCKIIYRLLDKPGSNLAIFTDTQDIFNYIRHILNVMGESDMPVFNLHSGNNIINKKYIEFANGSRLFVLNPRNITLTRGHRFDIIYAETTSFTNDVAQLSEKAEILLGMIPYTKQFLIIEKNISRKYIIDWYKFNNIEIYTSLTNQQKILRKIQLGF